MDHTAVQIVLIITILAVLLCNKMLKARKGSYAQKKLLHETFPELTEADSADQKICIIKKLPTSYNKFATRATNV